ncbi:MAG: type II toxin-antitoxin system HicB family antitoxin [Lachnospiraceae bacterium]|nr:type II toxin-antitoxin system HicB family antitoxin [Lachnospiraceae bacterium]
MKRAYITFLTLTKDENDSVLVEVPDLDILTEGNGIEDGIYMARDAIGLKGIYLEDEGRPIPEPSPMGSLKASEGTFAEEGETITTLVDIDFTEYRKKVDNKSVRRNVTIPNWLNREAEAAHINVSRVLQEALKEKLNLA